jgi:hypothetical protein
MVIESASPARHHVWSVANVHPGLAEDIPNWGYTAAPTPRNEEFAQHEAEDECRLHDRGDAVRQDVPEQDADVAHPDGAAGFDVLRERW